MDCNNFITVKNSSNHLEEFVHLMNATTDALKADSLVRGDYYRTRNGEKFESDVLECMKSKAKDYNFNPDLIRHTPSQHFPDIISNNYYGVEVKSTKNNSWKSTGSSIVESLREEQIQKIFMLFGILSKDNIDFKCKPYEDCLYDIAVTHSPRYLIDMNLENKGNTVFDKMGIPYDKFRGLGNEQIEHVRKYYKNKIRESGGKTMPWWIGEVEEVSSYIPSVLYTENTALRLLCDFENEDKNKLRQYIKFFSFLAFPQILGISQDKFRATTLWLCSRHSIIISNIRDLFSAGGTGIIKDIEDKTLWENVPKIICNMLEFIDKFSEVFTNESQLLNELAVYADYFETGKNNFDIWKNKVDENLKILQNNCDAPILVKDLLTMKLHSAKDNIYKVEIK